MEFHAQFTAYYLRQSVMLAVLLTSLIYIGVRMLAGPIGWYKFAGLFTIILATLVFATRQTFSIANDKILSGQYELVDLAHVEQVTFSPAPHWTLDNAISIDLSRKRGSTVDGHSLLVGNVNSSGAITFAEQIRNNLPDR